MITLTETASAKVREIMAREKKEDWKLRMAVRNGNGHGLRYMLGFDNETAEGDAVFQQDGITLVCDAESYGHLEGTQIDYQDSVQGQGFVFKNPNIKHECNCGGNCGC